MAKTLRKAYNKFLTYENLMNAHILSRRCKGYRKEIIVFNLKQEEYIMWLYERLKNMTYKHDKYTAFFVTEPKVRKVEKAKYIDRVVNRWLVDCFLKPIYLPQFIQNSYACIEKRGMHKACLDMQNMMKHCKRIWGSYYILKMDVRKFFDSINKDILLKILSRKIKDEKVMWLIKEVLFVQSKKVGIEIRKL